MSCCAIGCQNRNSRNYGLHFYRIPSMKTPFEAKRRRLWLEAINRKDWTDETIRNSRLCSAHFISGKASMDPGSPDFIPSLFSSSRQSQRSGALQKRFYRKRKRKRAEAVGESSLVDTSSSLAAAQGSSTVEQQTDSEPPDCREELCTSITDEEDASIPQALYSRLKVQHEQLLTECLSLRRKCTTLKKENELLKEALGSGGRFSFSSIRNEAQQFLFFTGLSTPLFEWLISKLKDSVAVIHGALSLEDHLLAVLIKLRLGVSNKDIAFRFHVTATVISSILRSWLPVMAQILKTVIKWPTRKVILEKTPKCFKRKYRQCRCIIDCTEIFIATPDNLTARAQTWSKYKNHHAVKYLVGVTPAGAISFVSQGWGGSISDKEITSKSGFLELLEPGDKILADRGFSIRGGLAAYGATLRIPDITRGKTPISAHGADTSRKLSSVRIHIEKVIGQWKKFKILTSVIPLSQVDILDDVVVVCAALTNLSQSVVPKR